MKDRVGRAAGDGFSNTWDRTTSVMNAGRTGGRDIVQFWYLTNYRGGCGCLHPNDYFADNLSDNNLGNGASANNNIRSHRWVTSCSVWLT